MEINKIGLSQYVGNLFTVKFEEGESISDYSDDIRLRFIELANTREDWAKEFLTNEGKSIQGDIFKEFDITDNIVGFVIWQNKLEKFHELRKRTIALFK